MRPKIVLFSIVLVLALLLSACVGVPVAETQQPRTLSVSGSAKIVLTPDIAYISIGVHTEAREAREAVANNNSQAQEVVAALTGLGIEARDIQTVNFSIYPQEKWSPTGESLGTFFTVDNTVYVTVRDIQKIGEILDAAIAAGANNVYGISFDVENKEAALSEGRAQAVENARTQAEELAKAAGIELGPIFSISYYGSSPSPIYDYKIAPQVGYGNAAVPISPGQLTMTVDVSVVYEIK